MLNQQRWRLSWTSSSRQSQWTFSGMMSTSFRTKRQSKIQSYVCVINWARTERFIYPFFGCVLNLGVFYQVVVKKNDKWRKIISKLTYRRSWRGNSNLGKLSGVFCEGRDFFEAVLGVRFHLFFLSLKIVVIFCKYNQAQH